MLHAFSEVPPLQSDFEDKVECGSRRDVQTLHAFLESSVIQHFSLSHRSAKSGRRIWHCSATFYLRTHLQNTTMILLCLRRSLEMSALRAIATCAADSGSPLGRSTDEHAREVASDKLHETKALYMLVTIFNLR
jgi:hypothetical protein